MPKGWDPTAIMGAGTARNHKTTRWHIIENIVWTWFMTLPATALVAHGILRVRRALGAGSYSITSLARWCGVLEG